jgi:hypothetical protein
MLTSSIEYKELKKKISDFLNVSIDDIYIICNPLKNKKKKRVYQVSLRSGTTYMLQEIDGFLKRI